MTTTAKGKSSVVSIETLLGQQGQLFKRLLKESLQEVLEAEMTEVVGAGPGERTADRLGYRAGASSSVCACWRPACPESCWSRGQGAVASRTISPTRSMSSARLLS